MRTRWAAVFVAATALLGAASAAGAGAGVPAESPDPESHVDFVPGPGKPLRVMVVGDSHADDNSPGIKAAFRATGVAKVHFLSSPGLVLYDWRAYWPGMLDYRDPHVVIIELGSWDRLYASEQPASYTAIVEEAIGLLTSRGAEIVWLGVAPMPPELMTPEQRSVLNGIYRRAAANSPHRVHYVNTAKVVGGPNGEFVEYLTGKFGQLLRVRKPPWNGHFCPAGAARIGAAALGDVRDRWEVPKPAKGWRNGEWIYNRRYVPPEPCYF